MAFREIGNQNPLLRTKTSKLTSMLAMLSTTHNMHCVFIKGECEVFFFPIPEGEFHFQGSAQISIQD